MATIAVTGRADLADGQWAVLESLLPRARKPGRPPEHAKRQLIDGIRWRTRAGAPWRDVPPGYGPWQTVYGLFRRWQRNGTWREILTALQGRADAAGLITWDVSVDSTVARAHQHAASARRRGDLQAEPPSGVQGEPANHGLGRSRTRPGRVLANKAYSSRANRAYLRKRGIQCTIPEKADQIRHRKNKGPAAARPPSTPKTTRPATRWSAPSAGSSATAPWPPAMTSWPSATKPPSA